MKYSNAYDLVLYLYNKKILTDFSFTGFGEVKLHGDIDDFNLEMLLKSIWLEWTMIPTKATAKDIGDYSLDYCKNEGLYVNGYCQDDYPYKKDEIQIDSILQSIIEYLELGNIDYDLPLNEQIDLYFKLEFGDVSNDFSIGSGDFDILDKEINEKLVSIGKNNLINFISKKIETIHGQLYPEYDFKIEIEVSVICSYSIYWHEKYTNLKESLGNIIIDY